MQKWCSFLETKNVSNFKLICLFISQSTLDTAMVWSTIKSKILGKFSLWDLLLEKLRLHEKDKMCESFRKQISLKDKLNFLLGQIEELLNEVTLMWNACCDSCQNIDCQVKH